MKKFKCVQLPVFEYFDLTIGQEKDILLVSEHIYDLTECI